MNYKMTPVVKGVNNQPEFYFYPELGRYYYKSPTYYDEYQERLGIITHILQKNEPWTSFGYGYRYGILPDDQLMSPAIKLAHEMRHASARTDRIPWRFVSYKAYFSDIADFYNEIHRCQHGESWRSADMLRSIICNIRLEKESRLRILLWPKKLRVQFDGRVRIRIDYGADAFPFHCYDDADYLQKTITMIRDEFGWPPTDYDRKLDCYLSIPGIHRINTEEIVRWFAGINLMAASDVIEGTNNIETLVMLLTIS